MAVYKPTFCYPFLNNIDIRTVPEITGSSNIEWLKCKINTSNKNITGYRIHIFDENNNEIFPSKNSRKYISPVSELQNFLPEDYEQDSNTGINGTFLYIPFFQNSNSESKLDSYNAVYFSVNYKANYFLADTTNWQLVYDQQGNPQLEYFVDGESSWDGYINNNQDKVSVGDLVLVPKIVFQLNSIGGIFQVGKGKCLIPVKTFSNIEEGEKILILCGQYGGKVYEYDENETSIPALKETTDYVWRDLSGNKIDFSIEHKTYKWSIELFQGEGAILGHRINYDNLSNDWFDTMLSSGKILGTTTKRIQIAQNFGNASIPDWMIPTFSSENPIVLQGTWMELFTEDSDSNSSNIVSSRVYVNSYDSTLGHVYPREGELSLDEVNIAKYARFYKYSNNPEYILDNDKVSCATTSNINLYVDESPTNPGLGVIDGYSLSNGERILVKDQDDPKENGIYIYDRDAPWRRSGSYAKWGDFLGKVIFIISGEKNGGKNYQSQAFVGGTLFYTDNSSQYKSADSPLYWIEELPLVLFNNKSENIYTFSQFYDIIMGERISATFQTQTVTVDVPTKDGYNIYVQDILGSTTNVQIDQQLGRITFNAVTGAPAYAIQVIYFPIINSLLLLLPTNKLDGVNVQLGDLCYVCYRDGQPGTWNYASAYLLKAVLDTNENLTWEIIKTYEAADNNTFMAIKKGRNAGAVYKYLNTSWSISSTVQYNKYDTEVLHNTDGEVLISPYQYIEKGQRIKLINGYVGEGDNKTQWIRINSLDKTIWKVTYDSTLGTIPSQDPDDPNVPYKYEIRSFFKLSDENPFSIYEQGYLTIDSNYAPFKYDSVDKRGIEFTGEYHQEQKASWESYRWILKNAHGEIIQDTGEQFDKEIKVNFYGLSNSQLDNKNKYSTTLLVTDEFGKTLEKTVDFEVYFSSGGNTPIRLVGEIDCDSQSIMFNIMDYTTEEIYEGEITYSVYRSQWEQYKNSFNPTDTEFYIGDWEPVIINYSEKSFRDFNIKNGYSYEYILYTQINNIPINQYGIKDINAGHRSVSGDIFTPSWHFWSLTELIPTETIDRTLPIVQNQFKANLNNIWVFKYNAEYGQQAQNFSKNEIETLGRYSKVGFGTKNYISGDISCLLGSEIIPYTSLGYIERLQNGVYRPLSTNEKIRMLEQWRNMAFSKNPKLLKDNKGQSWIVQIFSSSNTPYSKFIDQPDTINFSWKEIKSVGNNTLIWSELGNLPGRNSCNYNWLKYGKKDINGTLVSINLVEGVSNIKVNYVDPTTNSEKTTYFRSLGWNDLLIKKGSDLTVQIIPDIDHLIAPSEWWEDEGKEFENITQDMTISNGGGDQNYSCVQMQGLTISAGTGISQVYLADTNNTLWGYPSGHTFSEDMVYGYAVVSSGYHLEIDGAQMILDDGQQTNIYCIGSKSQEARINFGTINAVADTATYLFCVGENYPQTDVVTQTNKRYGVFSEALDNSNSSIKIAGASYPYSSNVGSLYVSGITLSGTGGRTVNLYVISSLPLSTGSGSGPGFYYLKDGDANKKILNLQSNGNSRGVVTYLDISEQTIRDFSFSSITVSTTSRAIGSGLVSQQEVNKKFSFQGYQLASQYSSKYNLLKTSCATQNSGERFTVLNCNDLFERKGTSITLQKDEQTINYTIRYYSIDSEEENYPNWNGTTMEAILGGIFTTSSGVLNNQDVVLNNVSVGSSCQVDETVGTITKLSSISPILAEGHTVIYPYWVQSCAINIPTLVGTQTKIASNLKISYVNQGMTQIGTFSDNAKVPCIDKNSSYTVSQETSLHYGLSLNTSQQSCPILVKDQVIPEDVAYRYPKADTEGSPRISINSLYVGHITVVLPITWGDINDGIEFPVRAVMEDNLSGTRATSRLSVDWDAEGNEQEPVQYKGDFLWRGPNIPVFLSLSLTDLSDSIYTHKSASVSVRVST